MAMPADDKASIENAMQTMRNAIREVNGTAIEMCLGWIEGGLTRLRIEDKEIEDAMHQIEYRAHWIDDRYKKELPEKFLILEKLLIKKFGIKPSK
ncbi:TPA: hypothetical protein H1012_00625 [archaeon]|nr:hypothetical protein [Candidatus Naiadarchaeales archaeon SRR2090153.bin461]HIK02334.1 hypothetical protein [Candidatus Naiadarchaeales archaeon SRR2090159.bin1288]